MGWESTNIPGKVPVQSKHDPEPVANEQLKQLYTIVTWPWKNALSAKQTVSNIELYTWQLPHCQPTFLLTCRKARITGRAKNIQAILKATLHGWKQSNMFRGFELCIQSQLRIRAMHYKITELSCRNSGTGNLFSFPSSLFHAQVHPVGIPSVANTRIFASLRRWQHLPAQHDTSIEFSNGRCFPNDALPGQSALMKVWGLLLWC